MAKSVAVLSEKEIELLTTSSSDPSRITNYFFSKKGKPGWQFDYRFTEEGKWQKEMCLAEQRDIVIIGGVGTGKTVGVGMAACVHALTTHPDFRFMNAAPTAYQAKIMYREILKNARGTRFWDLIWKAPERPYPMIEIRFMVEDIEVVSTLEFMSVDKNAQNIFSWEGDWANLEEGGLNDNLEDILTNVGTRLRGSAEERERLGRLSLITNPHENPTLWMYFDLAVEDAQNCLSKILSTYDNLNVTERQRERMIKRIPKHDQKRFLMGTRPEGRGIYFSAEKVARCSDDMMADIIKARAEQGMPGYEFMTKQGAGLVYFTTPPVKRNRTTRLADIVKEGPSSYLLVGDIGSGTAPFRNAPVLFVFDISDFPKMPARMVAAWWGDGGGSVSPFVAQLIRFAIDYQPIFTGVDSTGPSKGTAEMINAYIKAQRLDDDEIHDWLGGEVDLPHALGLPGDFEVIGMDFSGARKPAYLLSGRILIEAAKVVWPSIFYGMGAQLRNYDPLKDKDSGKHAQDLVATLCMGAYAIRAFLDINPNQDDQEEPEDHGDPRVNRYANLGREQREEGRERVEIRTY
jgi:hypothetical protein